MNMTNFPACATGAHGPVGFATVAGVVLAFSSATTSRDTSAISS